MADPGYIVDGVLTDGEAWVGLGTTTLGSDTAVVTFTSTDDGQVGDFSQYMDLVMVSYYRSDRASGSDYVALRLNNDSAANQYDIQFVKGNGAAPSALAHDENYFLLGFLPTDANTANIFGASVTHLFDVNSGKYKSVLTQTANDFNGSGWASMMAGTWKSQAPITELDFTVIYGSNLRAGSEISLFGVLPRMVA
jgi:hypothetical protein